MFYNYVVPQTSNPYVMWGNIKALYSIIKIFLYRNKVSYSIQKSDFFLLNTLHTLLMCFFQLKFSSIQIPRKDVDSTDSNFWSDSLISKLPDISYFLRLLLNSTYLVLLTLIVSLFESHHTITFLIFRLTTVRSILHSSGWKVWKRFESSANNLKLKYVDELGKSLI